MTRARPGIRVETAASDRWPDVVAAFGARAGSAVFTGTLAMFEGAGFREIGRTYPSRPVMRLELADLRPAEVHQA
jgi:hypothetical protein